MISSLQAFAPWFNTGFFRPMAKKSLLSYAEKTVLNHGVNKPSTELIIFQWLHLVYFLYWILHYPMTTIWSKPLVDILEIKSCTFSKNVMVKSSIKPSALKNLVSEKYVLTSCVSIRVTFWTIKFPHFRSRNCRPRSPDISNLVEIISL